MNGHLDLSGEVKQGLLLTGEVGADEVRCLFAEHGESALHRLRGAFAVALWDEKSRSLLLARR